MNMETIIKIEIGKKYRLRNGLETSPIRIANNGTNYIFEADVVEAGYNTHTVMAWKKNGRFLTDDIDNGKDIIDLL